MSARVLGILLAVAAFCAVGCGDDDGDGGGSADGCAHVQEICDGNANITIDCDQWDKAPDSVKDCAESAKTCDAVITCVAGG